MYIKKHTNETYLNFDVIYASKCFHCVQHVINLFQPLAKCIKFTKDVVLTVTKMLSVLFALNTNYLLINFCY